MDHDYVKWRDYFAALQNFAYKDKGNFSSYSYPWENGP